MREKRPYVLSIAGFDPSGGAGLLADVKTFEQHQVYGLSISTAATLQTEDRFYSIEWTELKTVLKGLDILLSQYRVDMIKIGIVPSFSYLSELIGFIKSRNGSARIVVDPVTRSSTGFDFQDRPSAKDLTGVLERTFLITPNIQEALFLTNLSDPKEAARWLAGYCNVLLKGGHNEAERGVDFLYLQNGRCVELRPALSDLPEKHGSGCVLSAAITANLARGMEVEQACWEAKKYVTGFLRSTGSLLGYHSQDLIAEHE